MLHPTDTDMPSWTATDSNPHPFIVMSLIPCIAAVCGRYQDRDSNQGYDIISTGHMMPQRKKEKKRLTTDNSIASVAVLHSAEKKKPLHKPVKPDNYQLN